MTETDKKLLQPIELFASKLDEPVPGLKRTLRELTRPDVLADTEAFLADARALADKAAWTSDGRSTVEQLQVVLEETKTMVTELSLCIRFQTVRDPLAEETLQPRIGRDDDEYLANLEALSARIEQHRAWLKERKTAIVVPPHLSADAVRKQGAAHRAAALEIAHVRAGLDGSQKKLESLRARGAGLQARLNHFLEYMFPLDRGTRLQFGYTERSRVRAKKAEAKPEPKPATPGVSDPDLDPTPG